MLTFGPPCHSIARRRAQCHRIDTVLPNAQERTKESAPRAKGHHLPLNVSVQMANSAGRYLNFAIVARQLCAIPGCQKLEHKAGLKYCGTFHRRRAVELKIESPCLVCDAFPRRDHSAFCSEKCSQQAVSQAPCLLPVRNDDPIFLLGMSRISSLSHT